MTRKGRGRTGVAAVLLAVLGVPLGPPQAMAAARDPLEAALAALETTVGGIERRKTVLKDDDLDEAVERYLDAALGAFRGTLRIVEADIEARAGADRALDELESLELVTQAHRQRLDALVLRLVAMHKQVRTGEVRLSKELVLSMGDDEVAEVRVTLAAPVRRAYALIDPRFGHDEAAAAGPAGPCVEPEICATTPGRHFAAAVAARRAPASALERLEDALFPRAHAALGLGCITACSSGLTPACAACIGAGGAAAVSLYNAAVASFRECNRQRNRILRALCKAAVVVGFVTALA